MLSGGLTITFTSSTPTAPKSSVTVNLTIYDPATLKFNDVIIELEF